MSVAQAYFNWMGIDVEATVDFDITHYGSPPIIDYVNGGDPGEDPEWEINQIILREDRYGDLGPEFEATGKLFDVLCLNGRIEDAILEEVNEDISDRRYSRRYWRAA